MKWRVDLAKHASVFIKVNNIPKEYIFAVIGDAIKNFQGEMILIDIRKMKGEWEGFYRIRKGKWRIIAEFNFDTNSVFIEDIDWRGNIY
jgi:mRNA interferase RelE/StbE